MRVEIPPFFDIVNYCEILRRSSEIHVEKYENTLLGTSNLINPISSYDVIGFES